MATTKRTPKIRTAVYRCYRQYPDVMGWSGFAEGRYCYFAGIHDTEADARADVDRLAAVAAAD